VGGALELRSVRARGHAGSCARLTMRAMAHLPVPERPLHQQGGEPTMRLFLKGAAKGPLPATER
jgi:hypothetical protein